MNECRYGTEWYLAQRSMEKQKKPKAQNINPEWFPVVRVQAKVNGNVHMHRFLVILPAGYTSVRSGGQERKKSFVPQQLCRGVRSGDLVRAMPPSRGACIVVDWL